MDSAVEGVIDAIWFNQGQVCCAGSRLLVQENIYDKFIAKLKKRMDKLRVGHALDKTIDIGAIVDKTQLDTIESYVKIGEKEGGIKYQPKCKYPDDGYYHLPTLFTNVSTTSTVVIEEIFGPVLSIHVYKEKDLLKTPRICYKSSAYALTGAIFAQDRMALIQMKEELEGTAGNFYLNDKPTGAVVGQQPFGGSRASGTNDKAGSYLNLIRWTSPRTVKETFDPPRDYPYPYMSNR